MSVRSVWLDPHKPSAIDMLAPTLHLRAREQLPVVWDAVTGRVAIVALDPDWPAPDELELALQLHTLLGRGVLALA